MARGPNWRRITFTSEELREERNWLPVVSPPKQGCPECGSLYHLECSGPYHSNHTKSFVFRRKEDDLPMTSWMD